MGTGSNVSEFTAKHLPQTIYEEINESAEAGNTTPGLDAEVIKSAFRRNDQELLEAFPEDPGKTFGCVKFFPDDFSHCFVDVSYFEGCTACVMIYPPFLRKFYIANIGDSRAVLCRRGWAVPLTSDHTPRVKGTPFDDCT